MPTTISLSFPNNNVARGATWQLARSLVPLIRKRNKEKLPQLRRTPIVLVSGDYLLPFRSIPSKLNKRDRMASYSPFSLPVLISYPPPKRFLPSSRSVLSTSKQSGLQHALSRAENGWWGFPRSVSSNGSPEIVVPRSVPVRVAHELLQAGHRYLDVRTVDEFHAGHAVGAKNIPYVFKVGSGVMKNPNFLKEVLQVFEEDDEIIIGCESGRRSLMAAAELSSAGFTGITDIAGGYSAWLQNGLPTEQ